jgi:hypothetical protein
VIELSVETGEPSAQQVVEAKVLENLRQNFDDFWKNREMRLYDLCVVACPPQSLRTMRKLKRVVDQRQMFLLRANGRRING